MKAAILGASILALLAAPAFAAPQSKPTAEQPRQCFFSRNITSWRPTGDRGVNLQVNYRDVYHLDLFGPCPQLRFAREELAVRTRGPGDNVCIGYDVDVLTPNPGGPPAACLGTGLRRLTPAEVKALPRSEQP